MERLEIYQKARDYLKREVQRLGIQRDELKEMDKTDMPDVIWYEKRLGQMIADLNTRIFQLGWKIDREEAERRMKDARDHKAERAAGMSGDYGREAGTGQQERFETDSEAGEGIRV